MNNIRRRKEIMVLAIMLNKSLRIAEKPQFTGLRISGPYVMLPQIEKLYQENVAPAARPAELNAVKMVVNALSPIDFDSATDEQRMAFTTLFVQALVHQGWRFPTGEVESAFVQALYDLGGQVSGNVTLPKGWNDRIQEARQRGRQSAVFG